jgi:competence CoiA-like predicted nuclease
MASTSQGSQIGKRYFCPVCGSEFVVTKAGAGTLSCHGQPLTMK